VTEAKQKEDAMRRWSVAHHYVSICGKVIDEVTRTPIARAEVRLVRVPREFKTRLDLLAKYDGVEWAKRNQRPDKTVSRADGLFYFLDLPDGKYEVRAVLPNCGKRYGAATQKKDVTRGELSGLKTLQDVWAVLALPPTGIKGKIIDAARKTGVLMAEVRLKGSGERTFCDARGEFTLAPIEASRNAKRTLIASAQGYKPRERVDIVFRKTGELMNLEPDIGLDLVRQG